MAKANRHMIKKKQAIKSQSRRTSFVFAFLSLAVFLATNILPVSAATGVMVGSDSLILGSGENIYYGAFSPSSNAGASGMLIQSPAGNNLFRLDTLGNVTATGTVKGMGGLCIGNDCRTSWDQIGGAFWNLSGSNLYASSTSWNLGIGTTNPGTKLDITGTFRNSLATTHSSLGGAGNVLVMADNTGTLYSAANPVGTALLPTGTSGYTLRHDGTAWVSNSNIYNNGTNVGVGTSTPTHKLEIKGGAAPWSALKLSSNDAVAGAVYGGQASSLYGYIGSGYYYNSNLWRTQNTAASNVVFNNDGSLAFYSNSGLTANVDYTPTERMRITTGGNVGIGTTAPGAKLDITGALRNSLATTHSPLGGAGNVLVMADNTGTLYSAANPVGTALLPTGTSGYTLRHDGTAWVSNSNVFNNGANVGIGTTNPGSKLSVSGDINATGVVLAGTPGTAPGDKNIRMYYDTGVDKGFIYAADWSGFYRDLILNYNGGNVGIGTTNPSAKLTVNGGIALSSVDQALSLGQRNRITGAYGVIQNTQTGQDWFGMMWNMYYDWSTGQYRYQNTNSQGAGGLFLENNSHLSYRYASGASTANATTSALTTLFTVRNTGNVGIGLTNPAAKLQITSGATPGFINSGSTQLSVLGGAGNVLVMADNTGTLYSAANPVGTALLPTGTSGSTLRHNGTAWISNTNLYNNGTNVGIGTTNPVNKLTIAQSSGGTGYGGTDGTGGLRIAWSSGYGVSLDAWDGGTPRWGIVQYSANTPKVMIEGRHNSNDVVFNSGGNVGVGTTNPLSKLELVSTTEQLRLSYNGSNYAKFTVDSAGSLYIHPTNGRTYWNTPSINNNFYVYNNSDGDSYTGVQGNAITLRKTGTQTVNISNSGNSYFNAGNVGIGLTNPAAKLQIVAGATPGFINSGSTQLSALGGAGGVLVMADNTGTLYATSTAGFLGGGTGGDYWALSGSNLTASSTTWNIGIGTTNPGYLLDVQGGQVNSSGGLCINGSCITAWNQVGGAYWNLNGSNLYASSTSWNLGVGVTNPTAKLHVVGATGIINTGSTQFSALGGAGNVLVMADNAGTLYSTANPTGTALLPTGSSGSTLRHNGTAWISNTNVYNNGTNVGIGTTNPTLGKLQVNGNLVVDYSSGIFGYNGGGTHLYSLTRQDGVQNASLSVSAYGGIGFTGGKTGGAEAANYQMFLNNAGNLGIGTTTPDKKLTLKQTNDIDGFRVYGSTDPGSYFDVYINSFGNPRFSTNNSMVFEAGSGMYFRSTGATFFNDGAARNTSFNNGQLYLTSAGNVGIGSTNPGATLDVTGTLRNSLATTHSLLGGSGNVLVAADNNGTLYSTGLSIGGYWNVNGTSIYNNNSGNVGVGTTNPLSKLNAIQSGTGFQAALRIENKTGIVNDATGIIFSTEAGLGGGKGGIAYNRTTSWARGDLMFLQNSVADGSIAGLSDAVMTIKNSGNVGIGVTAPSAKLEIGGGEAADEARLIFAASDASNRFTFETDLDAATPNDLLGIRSTGVDNILVLKGDGNIGIGNASPGAKLDITGTLRNSLATTHSLLGGSGQVFVMADNNGTLYATSSPVQLTGSYLPLTGGALSGDLNMSGNDISGVNKLTVTTIDPLYRIKGINYSTYASSVVGGVKEEYVGRAELKKVNEGGEYEQVIDFAKQKEGSDLWVWRKVVDFSRDNVDVLMTAYGRFAQVYYVIDGEKLIFRSDRPTVVSYRLVGQRLDWRSWPTKATNQQETPGFIIE